MPTIQPVVRGLCVVPAVLLLAMTADASVNQSIRIEDSARSDGQSTVNGRITIGSGAVVSGSVSAVNGSIKVADDVQLQSVSTVNGSISTGSGLSADSVESVNGGIRIGQEARLSGTLETVNGSVHLGEGSQVAEDVVNVNGEIEIVGSDIGGDLSTVSGDVFLGRRSVLRGDLIIEKTRGWGQKNRNHKPRVVIGADSRVLGTIRAEREIELFVSDSAEIGAVSGEASMQNATRFDGDRP